MLAESKSVALDASTDLDRKRTNQHLWPSSGTSTLTTAYSCPRSPRGGCRLSRCARRSPLPRPQGYVALAPDDRLLPSLFAGGSRGHGRTGRLVAHAASRHHCEELTPSPKATNRSRGGRSRNIRARSRERSRDCFAGCLQKQALLATPFHARVIPSRTRIGVRRRTAQSMEHARLTGTQPVSRRLARHLVSQTR